VSGVPWYFADFAPTAAAVAGVEMPGRDGTNVMPVLSGKNDPLPDRFMYWEYPEKRTLGQAVRLDRWKAHREGLQSPLELYDLEADPSESKDVSAAHPEVVNRIRDYLKSARTESPNWPTGTR
jgi:arylsulfatase A-like enzyme